MYQGYGPKKKQPTRKASRTKIPFQRVSAEIRIDSTQEVIEGRVFLNDLSPEGVGCFINVALDKGEQVSLVIEQPKHIYIKGEIIWCSPYARDTKILTQSQFNFRAGIQFKFDDEEEKAAVRKYCEELYADEAPKK